MTVVDRHMQQRVTDLVNACANYWELRGIAPEQRTEMRLELEEHLRHAVADGKVLDAVVGANPVAFAEAWARELPHHGSGGVGGVLRLVVSRWVAYVLAFIGGVALFDHLVLRAPTFSFTGTHALVVACFAVFSLLEAGGGFLALHIATQEQRRELIFALYALVSVLLLVSLRLAGVPLQLTLFRWAWPITVLVLLGAVGAFWLKSRFAGGKGPQEHAQNTRVSPRFSRRRVTRSPHQHQSNLPRTSPLHHRSQRTPSQCLPPGAAPCPTSRPRVPGVRCLQGVLRHASRRRTHPFPGAAPVRSPPCPLHRPGQDPPPPRADSRRP